MVSISKDQIAEIRQLRKQGHSLHRIAEQYKVNHSLIRYHTRDIPAPDYRRPLPTDAINRMQQLRKDGYSIAAISHLTHYSHSAVQYHVRNIPLPNKKRIGIRDLRGNATIAPVVAPKKINRQYIGDDCPCIFCGHILAIRLKRDLPNAFAILSAIVECPKCKTAFKAEDYISDDEYHIQAMQMRCKNGDDDEEDDDEYDELGID